MKWNTLRHNGVAFPPPYEYRGLAVKIRNEPVKLDSRQEEMLMAWAKKKDTPYVQDAVFQGNFLDGLKAVLPERLAGVTLDEIDWSELHKIADREKTANLSPEEKKKRSAERKTVRDELKARYGLATIDGIETEVGAYLVEPPGILMGRGAHPLRGKWKERVEPEQVTLNLDEEAPVPPAPDGHAWGKIVHEHDSMWIASWYDKLADKRKYVWLADSSHLRQERDKEKYLKAVKLESSVDRVRKEIAKRMRFQNDPARAANEQWRRQLAAKRRQADTQLLRTGEIGDEAGRKKLEEQIAALQAENAKLAKREERTRAEEMKTRQLASVCYLIDRLAMRVGDEKDEDEADTVGASTLRVEHIQIGRDRIEFNFLGKDSVEWHKSLPLDHDETILANNLQDFMRGKQPQDQIFDKIDSTHVNQFLSGIVPGLTAKVFRTFHATKAVRSFLEQQNHLVQDSPNYEKEYVAKLANLEAAVVCNHKRTPPKNWEQNLAKREADVQKLRAAQPDLTRLQAQIHSRERLLQKLLAAPPDPQRLLEQVKAKEQALEKLKGAHVLLPSLDDRLVARKSELDRLIAAREKCEAEEGGRWEKKQAVVKELESRAIPTGKKTLAQHKKRLAEARKEAASAKRAYDEKLARAKERVARARKALEAVSREGRTRSRSLKERVAQAEEALARARKAAENEPTRYEERIANARQALERASLAPETAERNYQERIEKAERQFDLARRTRDYNLGTSLKNYVDPRVYKAWGDYVAFDWKRLYTTALQRKFAWVEQERTRWNSKDDDKK